MKKVIFVTIAAAIALSACKSPKDEMKEIYGELMKASKNVVTAMQNEKGEDDMIAACNKWGDEFSKAEMKRIEFIKKNPAVFDSELNARLIKSMTEQAQVMATTLNKYRTNKKVMDAATAAQTKVYNAQKGLREMNKQQ